jgi:hypothetical protein
VDKQIWVIFFLAEIPGRDPIIKLQGVRRENSLQYID